jgi:hypothetical protein
MLLGHVMARANGAAFLVRHPGSPANPMAGALHLISNRLARAIMGPARTGVEAAGAG